MLYPVDPVVPNSYDKVLYLLAACHKYDMIQVQSSIRAEISRGDFRAPVGTEVFRAYAIAYDKGLIPEMENAARLTLGYPMTFETLGEAMRCFDGWAREQSGAGTKQGTYVRLCSKMFDDSPHHSYAVVVANSLAQLTQILGIGDAPDAAT